MTRRSLLLVLLVSCLIAPSTVLAQAVGTATPTAELQKEVQLFLYEDISQAVDEGCGIVGAEDNDRFVIQAQQSSHEIQRTIDRGGELVDADESPMDDPGCLFEFELAFPEAPGYTFRVAPTVLALIPFSVIEAEDDPLVIAMDQYGSRTPEVAGSIVPTPAPTPEPTPTPIPTPEPGKIDDDTYRIVGRFVLRSENVVNTSTGCHGTGGFSDVSDGAQIIIRDGNNNILGVGRLQDTDLSSALGCSYIFSLEVPQSEFYQVEFSHRSPLVYTFEDMEDMGWELWFSLGD